MKIPEFRTPGGLLVPAVSESQMVEVDRLAIEQYGPNLYQMMENAGRNLAECALEMVGTQAKVMVLAGTGGNGGGGICAARHLANRDVEVRLRLTNRERLGSVPAKQLEIYLGAGGQLGEWEQPDLILDAVIGYSLRGAPRGQALQMIDWCNRQTCPVLSLDIPSGLHATTGAAEGSVVQADTTMTLALPKTGLASPERGKLILADIGIPQSLYRAPSLALQYRSPFGTGFRVPLATKIGC